MREEKNKKKQGRVKKIVVKDIIFLKNLAVYKRETWIGFIRTARWLVQDLKCTSITRHIRE